MYHALRKQSYPAVIGSLEKAIPHISDGGLQWQLTDLCNKVLLASVPLRSWAPPYILCAPTPGKRASQDPPNVCQTLVPPKIQRGTHPAAQELLALRQCFCSRPLDMNQLQTPQMVSTLRPGLFHNPPLILGSLLGGSPV